MVVFVDFDDEGSSNEPVAFRHAYFLARNGSPLDHIDEDIRSRHLPTRMLGSGKAIQGHPEPGNPQPPQQISKGLNGNDSTESRMHTSSHGSQVFAAALGCYPIVKSITQWLDLTSLFSLSLTCRQFRANLLQFRPQLVRQTLLCEGEDKPLLSDILGREGSDEKELLDQMARRSIDARDGTMLLAPKIGKCARDLVGECRRCGRVVCRNCTIKPPADPMLRSRYRRICTKCLEVPLYKHTVPTNPMTRRGSDESTYSLSRPRSSSSYESGDHEYSDHESGFPHDFFTAPAFSRSPCMCATEGVWLCQPCGQGLRAADITYKRVWTWRSRYSTHIGGLGTGMGEGNQGQKCGRGDQCLAAKDLEVEIDCSAEVADELLHHHHHHHQRQQQPHSTEIHGYSHGYMEPPTSSLSRRSSYEQGPGYFRQEIEGIGGVVKKKVKKRVRVGATVTEYEDERETGNYLEREAEGINRSWCGWCSRVVPGENDLPEEGKHDAQ